MIIKLINPSAYGLSYTEFFCISKEKWMIALKQNKLVGLKLNSQHCIPEIELRHVIKVRSVFIECINKCINDVICEIDSLLLSERIIFEIPEELWVYEDPNVHINLNKCFIKKLNYSKSNFIYLGNEREYEPVIYRNTVYRLKPITQTPFTSVTSNVQKDESMNSINMQFLKGLAKTSQKDEYTTTVPEGPFKTAMEVAKAKRKEAQEAQLGEQMLAILEQMEKRKEQAVDTIRMHRKHIKENKEVLEKIDRTFAYAQETQNFMPLCEVLGFGKLMDEELKMPENWTPAK